MGFSSIESSLELVKSEEDIALFWDIPEINTDQARPMIPADQLEYRFFRICEIGEDKAEGYRLAMSNVLSILNDSSVSLAYLLNGTPQCVELYIGVASREVAISHEASKLLKGALEGNFPGIQLQKAVNDSDFHQMMQRSVHLGMVQGVPSFNDHNQLSNQEDTQGIERLVNSLTGEYWQMLVVAESGSDSEIKDILNQTYDLSTRLSAFAKQSIQKSENETTSTSHTEAETKGDSRSWSNSDSASTTKSKNEGWNKTKNEGWNKTKNEGWNKTENEGWSNTKNKNAGTNNANSTSTSEGKSEAKTGGSSTGTSGGSSTSSSGGSSTSSSGGSSTGHSESTTKSVSDSKNWSSNISDTEGKNISLGSSLTQEHIDKSIEELQKHLSDQVIERFRLGRSKGMFRTAVYLSAPDNRSFQMLRESVRSIFQGSLPTATPLKVVELPRKSRKLGDLLQLHSVTLDQVMRREPLLVNSIPVCKAGHLDMATWLNTKELALYTGIPTKELPGIVLRKSVDFAVNTQLIKDKEQELNIGHIVHHGRLLKDSPLQINRLDLSKHAFVTGVTGAGKTTTNMQLLESAGLPFMVIEPAKTEYRALHERDLNVEYYLPGREDITPFRLNPFELVHPRQNLAGHISVLTSTLTTVYPMEAAMPQLVEEAIIEAYSEKGWDLSTGDNLYYDNPWDDSLQGCCWPTFSDMIAQLDSLIKSKGMGREFEEKYHGSLVARLTNLTRGVKGTMLNTRRSINFDALLDKRVVIELEELKSEQDKALFMGLIVTRLAECMKHRHTKDPSFQHLTLIEEAHRLLSRPEPGESDAKKMGVEMLANMLAEVRKYGEGLIIADQIPNKLIPDVLKNTHTKIVHRLFAADDRTAIGDAMSLNDEQKDFLPLLNAGETVVYCGGWHAPVRAQIEELTETDGKPLAEEALKVLGQEQTWQQREQLFPNLTATGLVTSAEQLASLQSIGNRLLRLAYRCAFALTKTKKDQDKLLISFQKTQDRFSTAMVRFNPKGDDSMVYQCLEGLLSDTVLQEVPDGVVAEVLTLLMSLDAENPSLSNEQRVCIREDFLALFN
ncbi:ATP-binding protein [Oceanospirillum sediminis]|uniref:ATP-binding protein n=1 Tax=Oceanospirillum sediminis TaxID=2760088 RepID=A0A839IVD8_9GAMM|nr:ATP-binding protein [Oceanospirillum sediminis]MBB1488630.1 ATP-binding protein [Oceanospirillum sediminis]